MYTFLVYKTDKEEIHSHLEFIGLFVLHHYFFSILNTRLNNLPRDHLGICGSQERVLPGPTHSHTICLAAI